MAAVAAVGLVAAACSSEPRSPTTTTSGGDGHDIRRAGDAASGLPDQSDPCPGADRCAGGVLHEEPSEQRDPLQTSTYNAGPAEVTALLAGSLDAAYMGPNSAITAYSHDKAIRIISGATSGGAALVVSSSITSPSQLKGKTLATPQLGNTQDVALRTWLKKQGLTFPGPNGGSGEVTILPEANATTVTSFEAGTIAGAWVPEPYVAEMVAKGGHVLVNEKTQWPNGQFSTTLLVVARPLPDCPSERGHRAPQGTAGRQCLHQVIAHRRPDRRQRRPGHIDRQVAEHKRARRRLVGHDLHQ